MVAKTNTIPIQENHSVVKQFTIAANFKTDHNAPSEPPVRSRNEQSSSKPRSIQLLIHMVPPFVKENSPMFYIQINGDAIWKWREVYSRPRIVFDLFQQSILPLGYELMGSSRDRVGNVVAVNIRQDYLEQ